MTSGGLGTMGYGLPAAVGVQVAHPDSLVIDIAGDASVLMTMQEMSTAVQHDLPIKIFILNNQYMGMVRQWQQLLHGNRLSHSYMDSLPDFVKLAEAYGCVGIRAEKPDELDDAIDEMISVKRPVLFDCRVAALANCFPMIPSGKAHNEMLLARRGQRRGGRQRHRRARQGAGVIMGTPLPPALLSRWERIAQHDRLRSMRSLVRGVASQQEGPVSIIERSRPSPSSTRLRFAEQVSLSSPNGRGGPVWTGRAQTIRRRPQTRRDIVSPVWRGWERGRALPDRNSNQRIEPAMSEATTTKRGPGRSKARTAAALPRRSGQQARAEAPQSRGAAARLGLFHRGAARPYRAPCALGDRRQRAGRPRPRHRPVLRPRLQHRQPDGVGDRARQAPVADHRRHHRHADGARADQEPARPHGPGPCCDRPYRRGQPARARAGAGQGDRPGQRSRRGAPHRRRLRGGGGRRHHRAFRLPAHRPHRQGRAVHRHHGAARPGRDLPHRQRRAQPRSGGLDD